MTTSAPIVKVVDIPIVEPRREVIPKRLPTREPAPVIIAPIRIPEKVRVRR